MFGRMTGRTPSCSEDESRRTGWHCCNASALKYGQFEPNQWLPNRMLSYKIYLQQTESKYPKNLRFACFRHAKADKQIDAHCEKKRFRNNVECGGHFPPLNLFGISRKSLSPSHPAYHRSAAYTLRQPGLDYIAPKRDKKLGYRKKENRETQYRFQASPWMIARI
jgi:hypothetical protein